MAPGIASQRATVVYPGYRDGPAAWPARNGGNGDHVYRQLEDLVGAMRFRLEAVQMCTDGGGVADEELDAAHRLFVQVEGRCRALCRVLLLGGGVKGRGLGRGSSSGQGSGEGMGEASGLDGGVKRGEGHVGQVDSAGCGRPTEGDEDGEEAGHTAEGSEPVDRAWIGAVAGWRACLDELAAAHKLSLTNTYKRHAQSTTPEILDALFADRKSRAQVVSGWMKNFGAYKRMQGQSGVWSKWEAQFRNYEQVVQELAEISCLLQGLDSGMTSDRVVSETVIAPRGDTVLEFANKAMYWKPILRFRVSSHMLAETSPIFASMFYKQAAQEPNSGRLGQDEEVMLPPPPTPFVCKDGTRTLLYRMPQLELDKESSFTILLHAAHMHNDRVPREVSLEQFVALAEASLRYRCTSPLELFVEHRWLPQWVHKATDAMPDGLVVVSYAFGLRQLFTRVTKTAILNLVDEQELAGKNWPKGIKERIWAVRCAKMAQVHQTCARAVEEYLRAPVSTLSESSGRVSPDAMDVGGNSTETSTQAGSPPRRELGSTPPIPSAPSVFSQRNTTTSSPVHTSPSPRLPSTTPRCPKGSHWCDATNLGWLLLVYNSLHLLTPLLNPTTLPPSLPHPPPPSRSLSQLISCLRTTPSPPTHPDHHSSVCDPGPAFRAAINDVYNSVAGLTLFEIDGVRHGWALSARHRDEPQAVHPRGAVAPAAAAGTVDELAAAMGGLGVGEAGEVGGLVDGMGGLRLAEDEGVAPEEHGSGRELVSRGAAGKALGDEGVCLRILEGIDGWSDLRSAAVVNRSVYAVYRRNEMRLRRGVVGADGQGRAGVLEGDGGEGEQKKFRRALSPDVRLGREMQAQTDAAPGDDEVSISADGESGSGTETAPSTASESSSGTTLRTESPVPSSSGVSRRSTLSRRSAVNPFFKMTEEEARRILWGEPSPPLSPLLCAPHVRAFAAVSHTVEDTKFGGSGALVVEDKMLVTAGNKQLREDMDRRIGLG